LITSGGFTHHGDLETLDEASMAALPPLTLRQAARTIASALVVDDLARKTARALVDVTGARRTLVSMGGAVFAEAVEGGSGPQLTLRHDARSRHAAMPEGLRSAIQISKATLAIHDLAQSSFRTDDYVARHRPRAALVVPALGADEGPTLVGLAYLESDREGAFGPSLVEAVELLMDLFAASLANAQGYDALAARLDDERRARAQVEARATDAEQRLRAQERLASLGTIASGIAHEIKNPLNFINNFADISVGLAGELAEEIDRVRGALAPESAAYLDEIAADLAQNVGKACWRTREGAPGSTWRWISTRSCASTRPPRRGRTRARPPST
jgi:histidine kinase